MSERVEVIATRVPELPDTVPFTVQVFGGTELRNRGATDLRSALALATGIDIAPGGDEGPASAVPEIWGLREFDAFLLVVDGVPWGGAFNPALVTLDLQDVERIEVQRGPAPVMYGATSFVGVIHVVHRSQLSPPTFAARAGTFGTGGASAAFSIPMGGWQTRLHLNGERQGFSDARTSFTWAHALWSASRSSPDGRLWFSIDTSLVDQHPASPHPRAGTSLSPDVPLDANHNPAGAFIDNHRVGGLFGLERVQGRRAWTTLVSASHENRDVLRGFLQEISDDASNARGLREQIHLTDVYADTHVAWNFGSVWRLLSGADLLHGTGNARGADFSYHAPVDGASIPTAVVPSELDVSIDDRRNFFGGYVATEWTPATRVRIDAGFRLNLTNEERERNDELQPVDLDDPGTQTNVRPSGSVGAMWTAWSHVAVSVRLFGNYRNTFTPAAVDFGIGDAGEAEGPLRPETSQSLEGGFRAAFAQGRVEVEATAFLMNFANLVIAQTVNGLPALTNAGTERFKGVELGTAWRLAPNITSRATYSFHQARFRDFVMAFDGVATQLGGKRLEMSPEHLMAAGFLYAPPRGVLALAEVGAVGSRYLNKRNTALADGYVTLTAGMGYRTTAWEFRVDGRNLTNTRPPVSESELGDAQYYRLSARRMDVAVSRSAK